MMKRYTYAVFLPGSKWARTNNKQQAIAFAKQHGGYVTAMSYQSGRGAWDAPTFRACSDIIADFRGVLLCDTCREPLPIERIGTCDACIAAADRKEDEERARATNARFDRMAAMLRAAYPTRIPEEWLR